MSLCFWRKRKRRPYEYRWDAPPRRLNVDFAEAVARFKEAAMYYIAALRRDVWYVPLLPPPDSFTLRDGEHIRKSGSAMSLPQRTTPPPPPLRPRTPPPPKPPWTKGQ